MFLRQRVVNGVAFDLRRSFSMRGVRGAMKRIFHTGSHETERHHKDPGEECEKIAHASVGR